VALAEHVQAISQRIPRTVRSQLFRVAGSMHRKWSFMFHPYRIALVEALKADEKPVSKKRH